MTEYNNLLVIAIETNSTQENNILNRNLEIRRDTKILF